MRSLVPALLAALIFASPAAAQDFLQDFEDFVEEMLPSRTTEPAGTVSAPARPTPPSVARPVAPTAPTPNGERRESRPCPGRGPKSRTRQFPSQSSKGRHPRGLNPPWRCRSASIRRPARPC
jgi:hypothetical protein